MPQKLFKNLLVPASLGIVMSASMTMSMENNEDSNLKVGAGMQLKINLRINEDDGKKRNEYFINIVLTTPP